MIKNYKIIVKNHKSLVKNYKKIIWWINFPPLLHHVKAI